MIDHILIHIRALSRSFDALRQELDSNPAPGLPIRPQAWTHTYFARLAPIIEDLANTPEDPDALAALQRMKDEIDSLIQRHRIRRLN